MARPGILYEEVEKAINELQANGERITISRVRETLGNRGSTTTISRYLKQWKTFQAAVTAGAPASTPPSAPQRTASQTEPQAVAPVAPESSVPAQPATPSSNYSETPVQENVRNQGAQQGRSKKFKAQEPRAHYNDKNQRNNQRYQNRNGGKNNRRHFQDYSADESVVIEASKPVDLETLSKDELIIKIRQLESELIKEAARREAADKLADDAKDYADIIKREVSERVNDNAAVFEEMLAQLKSEALIIQKRAETDLIYYREQLDRANQQIMLLMAKHSDT